MTAVSWWLENDKPIGEEQMVSRMEKILSERRLLRKKCFAEGPDGFAGSFFRKFEKSLLTPYHFSAIYDRIQITVTITVERGGGNREKKDHRSLGYRAASKKPSWRWG